MPEQLTPEAERWRDCADRFALDVLLPLADTPAADARPTIIEQSQASGLYTLTQPAAFGGSAADQLTLCAARDALMARNPPHSSAVFGPGPGVLAGVDEPLRSRYLEPLLSGRLRSGFARPDPGAAPHFPRAEPTAEGYLVNGQKSYVTGGASADFLNTVVQIDDKPALLIIDTAQEGVERERVFQSIDGSQHAAFRFRNALVPTTNLLAAPGAGMPKALGQIGDTRLMIAANCVGLSRWVYQQLCEHLDQPARGGGQRGDDAVARLRLGECYVALFAARSMLYRTARLADGGDRAINEAMACKVFAVDTLTQLIDSGIQLIGGGAVVEDHPLARLYREVRSLRLAEGATDQLLRNIARGRLELGKGRL
ncbi:MAG: acyl-CoA dehydrogenase family protein [Pseudomonadota bacterium]